jgi:protein-L-isoaspartate(D-aspartate) O-methyltransferase
MVAIMCERLALEPGLRVLEIGTGTGYHAAVTAHLISPGGRLATIDYHQRLAEQAAQNLSALKLDHVRVADGDGARGWPDEAPFDRIYLTCAAPAFPAPLRAQLAPDGILLGPVRTEATHPSLDRLTRERRSGDGWLVEDLGPCAFVPLLGPSGFTRKGEG